MLRYRARRMGFGGSASARRTDDATAYELKPSTDSSHGVLLALARPPRPAARVLDVGCSDGRFADSPRATATT